ncbi:hypothetical protein GS500_18045 [Rhodococcus hoagii]|nr:hypothetical protein [Prescottella equi]
MSDDLDVEKGRPGVGPKTVFVVSPIGTPGTTVAVNASLTLEYIVREALPEPEWHVMRADEETDPGSITNKVIERIVTSDLIVADLTGHNPNVFYELAVAHGYKKPVVTIMTDGEKVPFDIVDMRTVFYDLTNPASVHTAKTKLRASAHAVLANPNPTNPLVAYAMFSTASNGADATPADKLEFGMGQVLRRLRQIESSIEDLRAPSRGNQRAASRAAAMAAEYFMPVLGGDEVAVGSLAERQVLIAQELERINYEIRQLESLDGKTGEDVIALDRLKRDLVKWRRRADTHGVTVAEPE